jgi:formate dehydrogenase alpha subunit
MVSQFVAVWKDDLVLDGNATFFDLIEKARRGEIKALYLVGVDPLTMFPHSVGVKEALRNVELVICQDLFLTETAQNAHFVLPGCSFAEKDGSFTNQEGRVQKVNKAVDPVGESKADWEIFSEISRELQYPLEYEDAQEVYSEIARLVPLYQKRSAADLLKKQRRISLEKYLSMGYLDDFEDRYGKAGEPAKSDAAYPFVLAIGPVLFHSGRLSLQSEALMKINPEGRLQTSPEDAQALGLKEGDRARIRSTWGTAEVRVKPNQKIPQGLVFFPEVFAHGTVLELFKPEIDSGSKALYYKTAPVSLERI